MNFRSVYTFFALAFLAFLFYNSSGGPAAVQGQDRTGSPLSSAICQSCHTSGAFSPTIEVILLEDGMPVSDYEGGKTYTLRVTVTPTTGTPARYGFQAVALTGGDNINAGNFSSPPAGFQITELNERQYAEHGSPRTENTLEIDWQAPAAGTGDVRFYAGGVAANNGDGSGGDGGVRLIDPLVISELLSSDGEALAGQATFELIRNPVRERARLRLQTLEGGRYVLRLFAPTGRTLQSRTLQLSAGAQTLDLDTGELPGGFYYLALSDGKKVVTRKLLKI